MNHTGLFSWIIIRGKSFSPTKHIPHLDGFYIQILLWPKQINCLKRGWPQASLWVCILGTENREKVSDYLFPLDLYVIYFLSFHLWDKLKDLIPVWVDGVAAVQLLSRVLSLRLDGLQHGGLQSFAISLSLHKFMSIESIMPSNHLILCWPFYVCL